MNENQINFAIVLTYFANYTKLIRPHVASLLLQLIIKVYKIIFNVAIGDN